MTLEKLNPFIRHAQLHAYHHATREDSICYDCRLFYAKQGCGSFHVNGEIHPFNPGTLIFLPPRSEYRFSFPEGVPIGFYVLSFDLTSEFSTLSKSLGIATRSTFDAQKLPVYELPEELSNIIIQRNATTVLDPIERCIRLFLRKDSYYKLFASGYLKLALIQLLCEQRGEKSDYRLVEGVLEYIREHYQSPELNNDAIAAHFSYHPYYLSDLIKRHTGRTLHHHLIEYRLHMARHYLATTNRSVAAVAEEVGFASYTYFIKKFRERTGITPLQYRKSMVI